MFIPFNILMYYSLNNSSLVKYYSIIHTTYFKVIKTSIVIEYIAIDFIARQFSSIDLRLTIFILLF